MENTLEEQLIDQLLNAYKAEGKDHLVLHAKIQERKRKLQHIKHKETQPLVDAAVGQWDKLIAFAKSPLTPEDAEMDNGAVDHLLLTVQDSIDTSAQEDFLFALVRVWRKVWCLNRAHLGPIEGLEVVQAAQREKVSPRS